MQGSDVKKLINETLTPLNERIEKLEGDVEELKNQIAMVKYEVDEVRDLQPDEAVQMVSDLSGLSVLEMLGESPIKGEGSN